MRRTVAELAKLLGVSARRVEYAVKTRGIEPAAWVGSARVFDRDGCARITQAVLETRRRPAPGRGPAARA